MTNRDSAPGLRTRGACGRSPRRAAPPQVGTRFVAAKEAGAPPRHQKGVVDADYADTIRTIIFTGRPMRVLKNDYILDWEENKSQEIRELTTKVRRRG